MDDHLDGTSPVIPPDDDVHGSFVGPSERRSLEPVGVWVGRLDVASASDEFDARVFSERTPNDEIYDDQYASYFEEDRTEAVMTEEDAIVFDKAIGRDPRIVEFREPVGASVLEGGLVLRHMTSVPKRLALTSCASWPGLTRG